MAVSGLSARSDFVYRARVRPRDRRPPADVDPEPRPAGAAEPDPEAGAPAYAARFKADLYALSEIGAAARAGPPLAAAAYDALAAFLGDESSSEAARPAEGRT